MCFIVHEKSRLKHRIQSCWTVPQRRYSAVSILFQVVFYSVTSKEEISCESIIMSRYEYFSSVQFKMISMRSGRPIWTPPRLSGVSPMLPLKQFHYMSTSILVLRLDLEEEKDIIIPQSHSSDVILTGPSTYTHTCQVFYGVICSYLCMDIHK